MTAWSWLWLFSFNVISPISIKLSIHFLIKLLFLCLLIEFYNSFSYILNTLRLVWHGCLVYEVKYLLMFQRIEMRKEGLPLPLAFWYLILMTWSVNLVMISSMDSKRQVFKFGVLVFQLFYEMKLKTSKLKFFALEKILWPNSNHKLLIL